MNQEIEVVPTTTMAWTPAQVMAQVNAIQQLMRDGMTEGEHFGVIPGTNSKNVLLKAGAEKLCLMFRLAPRFDILEKELPNGHKDIRVKCSLSHINTGAFWGEGIGSCSTMEAKYRYRTGVGESTGVKVPKDYWEKRRIDSKAAMEMIGGKGYTTKKGDDGIWWIHEKIDKTENPDIADVYNTVLKIGKKRALVDATLTATAASDIFTQDLEETLPEKVEEVKPEPQKTAPEPLITHDEQLEVHRMLKEKNVSKTAYLAHLDIRYGIKGTAQIKKKDYDNIYAWIIQNEQVALDEVES